MNRSGYSDDCDDPWALIRWRGAVSSAIKGKRGQQLLRELITALDAMPEKRLIAGEFELNGEVCALGCVGVARGMDMNELDMEDDPEDIADAFGIAPALAKEIMFVNDEYCFNGDEQRWIEVRRWAESHLLKVCDA